MNSDPATNNIDSFESLDNVDPDKTSLKRLDVVNCKENNFETALQRATEYATLVANLQRRVGADLNSLCLPPNLHNNADIFNIHSKFSMCFTSVNHCILIHHFIEQTSVHILYMKLNSFFLWSILLQKGFRI